MRLRLVLFSVAMIAATAIVATTAVVSAQSNGPAMTVTPQSGVRPVSALVTGTPCSATRPAADVITPHEIRIVWQVQGNPSTAQVRVIADGQSGAAWSTTLELGVANIGTNLISASCWSPAGVMVLKYPERQVEVLPIAPVLSATPTSIIVGESLTATADQCPDPDGPILGGGYFVRFTLEYLIPPSGTEGPYSDTQTVWTNSAGVAQAVFTLPSNAPTEGGAYRLNATCELEEFGANLLFTYPSVAIAVSAVPTPTPTATPTLVPTVTPTPQPTATAVPQPTATSVPQPTATSVPQPTATPTLVPTATPTPRPGGGPVIIFTG